MQIQTNAMRAGGYVTPQGAPAEKKEAGGLCEGVKDFFSYTAREWDPHEGMLYTMRKDIEHSGTYTAKLAGVGTGIGLGLGLLVGSTVALPVVGPVAGVGVAQYIADKASTARNMAVPGLDHLWWLSTIEEPAYSKEVA